MEELSIGKKYLRFILIIVFIAAIGVGAFFFYFKNSLFKHGSATAQQQISNPYIAFLSEVYEKIKINYWDKISDDDLSKLFKLGVEKLMNAPQNLKTNDEAGIQNMIADILKTMDDGKKKDFSGQLADVVLANLKPFGRSRLYTTEQKQALGNEVSNINPEKDLYATLGITKGASQKEVDKAFNKESATLKNDKTANGKKKLEELTYAHDVLNDSGNKQKYDNGGIEPIVFAKIAGAGVYYMHVTRISPTTIDEFQKVADAANNKSGLNSLILDLRGNIGGAVDVMPYFLGAFIGQGQYAYDLFQQGNYTPYKTLTGWLPSLARYKRVVVLIDGQTQSSAELMAATLKKYNVGVLIGEHTKGWGTIEKVFDIEHQIDPNQKLSALLVHHITLRDDGQPIESRGVDPTIDMNDKKWQNKLLEYFNSQELVRAVKEMWDHPLPASSQ